MSYTELRFDAEGDEGAQTPHDVFQTEAAAAYPQLRLLDDSEVPASGELHAAPPCGMCFESMSPVGGSGWWCDPCQEYQ